MAKAMQDVIIHATKVALQKSLFILVTCNELTTINNHSWLYVHAYVTNDWK
jgi:hypothetical protein